MPQSYEKILLHIVFSTKNRMPFLKEEKVRKELHAYIMGICKNQKSPGLVIGGASDHVHIVLSLSRKAMLSELVKEIKRSSSRWVKEKFPALRKFSWQGGYGAFSIGQSMFNDVVAYIRRQDEHHKRATFQEEFRKFLDKYKIKYDESYLWE